MKLLESHIERAIADYLALDAWYVRHFEATYSERKRRGTGEVGMPVQAGERKQLVMPTVLVV